MEDMYCTDCKRNTVVVLDRAAGDTICTECGLVLESRTINETAECRNSDGECGENNTIRAGRPVDPLLGDSGSGLSTMISKGPNGSKIGLSFPRFPNHANNPDRAILLAFDTIATMADRLSLVATIKDRAREIYKRLKDKKCTKGRSLDALVAACIYIACIQEGNPRTIKEIQPIANGATRKEILGAKKCIVKMLMVERGKSMELGTTHTEDYLKRFCSNLCLSNEEMKAVKETIQNADEFDIRRNHLSIAAATTLMITQLAGTNEQLLDISITTNRSEISIREAYKDLYPIASKIIPEWYARGKDLDILAKPIA